jgi:phosphoglycerate dehydrogenase-like enzyme
MAVICLPDKRAVKQVGPLPDDVQVVVWDGRGRPDPDVTATEFLVPTFAFSTPEQQRAVFAELPKLRAVQLLSAGVDFILGNTPPGVLLCDARGVHGGSTAEWTMAALLASLREIPRFVLAAQEHRWDQDSTDELAGKRVLVIGSGDLGGQMARRLRAFDAEPTMVARTARAGVHAVTELPELLPHAEVVVLVVPLTSETRGMVDAGFLAAMPDGSLLVNAARGPIVDTGALLAELQSRRVFAALDVTDPEPLPPEHPLWDAPNLLLTPHVAGSVRGFPRRAYALVREQILRFAAGEPLINVVEGEY